MNTAFASMEYPHWLIVGGILLLLLGLAGRVFGRRAAEAKPDPPDEDQELPPGDQELPELDGGQTAASGRAVREKRRDLWAERFGESEGPPSAPVKELTPR